ncbi:MAG TPA: exonuclease domain-containing protein [Ktedonobacterales bacterium]
MRPEPVRVAIDLETTGLRPEQDAIIEIGAVKFAGAQTLDTFQSFVSISSPLPYRIHRLTGITSADLRRAPPLGALLSRLRAFIGTAPLVGHSVAFDASFLRKAGLAHRNPLLDTYELASLLLPDLPSYTLASVADTLKIPSSTHHRALADADLSRAVFLALVARLNALDTPTVDELAALPTAPGWTPAYLIRGEARERAEAIKSSPFAGLLAATPRAESVGAGMSPALLSMAVALEPHPAPVVAAPGPADEAALGDVAARRVDSPQREPAASLHAFMREGGALLLEVERTESALVHALAEVARATVATPGARVLVAASDGDEMTRVARSLMPRALAMAGVDAERMGVAELAEREAYLCLQRWFGVAREERGQSLSTEVTRGLAKLTVWARDTRSGMRADVALSGAESEAWARVRSGVEFADTRGECPYLVGGYCFVGRGEQRAGAATIVVTTHAALAAQLAGRDSLLPDATRVIILDGRQFEDELRRQRTFTLDAAGLLDLLDSLAPDRSSVEPSGILPLAASLRPDGAREQDWYDAVERARAATFAVFAALRVVLQESQERNARGGQRGDSYDNGALRVDGAVRASRAWEALAREWGLLHGALGVVAAVAREAAERVASDGLAATPRALGAQTDLLGLARRIDDVMRRGADTLATSRDDNIVCWLRAPQNQQPAQSEPSRERRNGQRNGVAPAAVSEGANDPLLPAEEESLESQHDSAAESPDTREALLAEAPTLFAAPAQIGALTAPLWAEGRGVAALGWALSVGGDFEYTRVALGLPESTRTVGSMPDYSGQTLLCLPTDAPEPAAQSYHAQFESLIVSLARALDGDVVAIFPSHAALRAAAMGIRRTLERHDILVLAQGIDGSARQLWQSFYGQPRTVLLGAGTFWDGAEQRNRAPACVVVARTPFPPQSDPLVAGRADVWADPQTQFMTPQAALKLRQALGGLAWSHKRRNAVVLYDRRLQTRSYGGAILGALPQCELYQAPAADLAERIADWTRE